MSDAGAGSRATFGFAKNTMKTVQRGDDMLRRVCTTVVGGALLGLPVAYGSLAAPAPAPAAAPAADSLMEITVTAEKTTQSLQKTPAAVTVISADTLIDAGVTDLREAQKLVPSVRFQAEGNNTQVFIRGVGANLDFANVEPNVAFNFAGIYMPREAL